MTTNIEPKINKPKWGEGPWQHEPDRVQWQHAGYVCLAQRNPMFGFWCGYVGVGEDHPYYGKLYDVDLIVHGAYVSYGDTPNGKIWHVPEPGIPEDVWLLGFSCDHEVDWYPGILPREKMGVYRTFDYVKEQIESLAEQLWDIKFAHDIRRLSTLSAEEELARIILEGYCITKQNCLKTAKALIKMGWRKP